MVSPRLRRSRMLIRGSIRACARHLCNLALFMDKFTIRARVAVVTMEMVCSSIPAAVAWRRAIVRESSHRGVSE